MDQPNLIAPLELVKEIWKPVPDYDGRYEVSNCGRIRNSGGRILSPALWSNGYFRIPLWKNGESRLFYVHWIVATVFIGPSDLTVNHKDGVKRNNVVTNLEWLTNRENMLHAYRSGLIEKKGEAHHMVKLDNDKVAEIRRLYVNGVYGLKRLAKQFGVHETTIHNVVHRKTWGHI
jgi:NUMOD4 motif/HNH endonuclease